MNNDADIAADAATNDAIYEVTYASVRDAMLRDVMDTKTRESLHALVLVGTRDATLAATRSATFNASLNLPYRYIGLWI